MFTADMIAPCGLDCSLCRKAHDKINPCPGCNGPAWKHSLRSSGMSGRARIAEDQYVCIQAYAETATASTEK